MENNNEKVRKLEWQRAR